jgi:recombination protein RecA
MRKLTAILNKAECTIIFINQLREKVGVIYGNPETTSGGRALKFYASIRIDIRRGEAIKEGSKLVGNVAKIRVVKNKVSPPFAGCEVDIIYGRGISKLGEIVDLAADREIIKKSGSWYEVNGEKMGQGREAAQNFLLERPELLKSIEDKLRHKN